MQRWLRCVAILVCSTLLACTSAEPWRLHTAPWETHDLLRADQARIVRTDGSVVVLGEVAEGQDDGGRYVSGRRLAHGVEARDEPLVRIYASDVVRMQTRQPSPGRITATWVAAGILVAGIIVAASMGVFSVSGGVNLTSSLEGRAGPVNCDLAAPFAPAGMDGAAQPCSSAAGLPSAAR